MRMLLVLLTLAVALDAQGLRESAMSTATRPILNGVQAGVPATRGAFTFAQPYGTQGYRLTDASDCPATTPDCVLPVHYSYWSQVSVSGSKVHIVGTLKPQGLTLFRLERGQITKIGPLFAATDARRHASGEGWYFSRRQPDELYVTRLRSLERFNVRTRTTRPVLDITAQYGATRYLWQAHSSADDAVHSFTLRDVATEAMLGCVVYTEPTASFRFFPATDMDECQIDHSGRWLLIKDNVDGKYGEDNRLIELETGTEQVILDEHGAAGHSDNGRQAMVAKDNWSVSGAIRLWRFGQLGNLLVYRDPSWTGGSASHISWSHGSLSYACASDARIPNSPRGNEVVCFTLDGTLRTLVVAPVMTDLSQPSQGGDWYKNLPKGHLDATGRYFLWSTNLGTNRTDLVLVEVPWARPSAPTSLTLRQGSN